ncbi:MAG TPA: hypothetical protein DCR21_04105 [Succinivibrionaceae bacterium]|nr:hypothetical protein [Succinivibrionaceae bacterium]
MNVIQIFNSIHKSSTILNSKKNVSSKEQSRPRQQTMPAFDVGSVNVILSNSARPVPIAF